MLTPLAAIQRLQAGNGRFVANTRSLASMISQTERHSFVSGQTPFAIILGCADSRVPAELIFDQGIGDLFVIRVAGNIVTPTQLGSIEYAAAQLGTRLIVVLGHTECGAVKATLDELQGATQTESPNLRALIDQIRPAVATLLPAPPNQDPASLTEQAVRANIRHATHQIRHGSTILAQLIAHDGLLVVGAEYSLASGHVDFFDGMP